MAENDIIFDVGLEADTSKIQQQIKNLRVPAIKIPTVIEKASARQRIISAKSGTHAKDVEYLGGLIVREALVTGSTPTQSYNRIMGSKAGMTPFQQQLGTQAVTFATQQINASKEQQRQENLATRIAERTAREESLLSQIQQTSDIANLPALTKKQLLGMGRSIQNIPVSQQTETQKKILDAANELIDSTNNNSKTNNKLIGALGSLGSVIAAFKTASVLAQSGINEYKRGAEIGFYQAANPEYKPGYTNWLKKVGLSEQQAERAQYEITTFRRRLQMGQISDEELRSYGVFGKDIYGALTSNVSFEQKIMQIRKALRATSAEDRAQLMQSSAIANLLVSTLAYSDEDLMGGYKTAMATGAAQQARVAGALDTARQEEVVKQLGERGRQDFKNTLGGAKLGGATGAAITGLGALASVIAAPFTGGASLAALPAILAAGTGLTIAGTAVGGAVGLGIDTAQNSGIDMFDYNKVIPVQDVSQREITINNTFQIDSENVYNQTTHHLISSAETSGVM